jgi:2-phospho-L-lactate guanylyltransferase
MRAGDGSPRALLVPSHDGKGTNALLMSPPGALQPSFGPGSFLRHLGQAVARKVDVEVLQPAGLAHDIDEPRDLVYLMARRRGVGSYAFLEAQLGMPDSEPRPTPRRTEP